MLEIKFREALLLKQLVDAIRAIGKEVNLCCRYGGIDMQAMDDSHIALVNLVMVTDSLAEYRCDKECIIGLNLAALHKMITPFASNQPLILRRAEDDQVLTIVGSTGGAAAANKKQNRQAASQSENVLTNEDENDEEEDGNGDGMGNELFGVGCNNTSDSTSSRRNGGAADDEDNNDENMDQMNNKIAWNRIAKLKLTLVEKEQFQIPENTRFAARVWLPTSRFSQIIRGNIGLSEIMTIVVKPETIEFSTDAEMGHTSTVLRQGVGELRDSKAYPWSFDIVEKGQHSGGVYDDTIEMELALSYLQKFLKASPLSQKMELSLSRGIPLRLKFPIGGNTNSLLEFFLAPKLEEN